MYHTYHNVTEMPLTIPSTMNRTSQEVNHVEGTFHPQQYAISSPVVPNEAQMMTPTEGRSPNNQVTPQTMATISNTFYPIPLDKGIPVEDLRFKLASHGRLVDRMFIERNAFSESLDGAFQPHSMYSKHSPALPQLYSNGWGRDRRLPGH